MSRKIADVCIFVIVVTFLSGLIVLATSENRGVSPSSYAEITTKEVDAGEIAKELKEIKDELVKIRKILEEEDD